MNVPSSSPSCVAPARVTPGWGREGRGADFGFPLIFVAVVFGDAEWCLHLPFVDPICPGALEAKCKARLKCRRRLISLPTPQ